MYRVAPLKLAFSFNLLFAVSFALFTGVVLTVLNSFLA
jgi:hypothetical protein